MHLEICDSLENVDKSQWNPLVPGEHPFLRHEFLVALERHHCVGEATGWLPHHVLLRDAPGGSLQAAIPLYLKYNSYGELVFDWSWADAYQRLGRAYYPKLVSALPYTPVTSPRLLIHPKQEVTAMRRLLLTALAEISRESGVSSLHVLFPQREEVELARELGWPVRLGCQFHWHNRDCRDFQDYLDHFNSRTRKKIRRERDKVRAGGLVVERLRGDEASAEQWQAMYRFYRRTFEEKGGWATLSEEFFQEIATTMGGQILLVLARRGGNYVAGALSFLDDSSIYGRHWGADNYFDALHFELCYYQGIEHAIDNGLRRFEPGAQGEYKITRGFEPTATWSLHWLRDGDFAAAVTDFTVREARHMERYIEELTATLPFRRGE